MFDRKSEHRSGENQILSERECENSKAKKFVKSLLSEGDEKACDESVASFKRKNDDLPEFYDDNLFRRGQRLYEENIFSFHAATLFGLVAVLSVPSILKILRSTNESSSDLTAYKRYRATEIYYRMWHHFKFGPNSDLWKTLTQIRALHNAASKAQHKRGQPRISQKDMAFTQFGFMGLHLVRSKFFALEHLSSDDWIAYIHYWRVMGWILGIDDRFNICRESVKETRDICQLLTDEFLTYYRKHDSDFMSMVRHLVNGLWHLDISLNYNVVMAAYGLILEDDVADKKKRLVHLSLGEKLNLAFQMFVIKSMRLQFMRIFWNLKQRIVILLGEYIPILAILDYGYKNSFVYVLGKYR